MKISIKREESIVLELTKEQFKQLIKVFDKISSDYTEYLLGNSVVWADEDFELAGDIGFYLNIAKLGARL